MSDKTTTLKLENDRLENDSIKAQVSRELDKAKQLAKKFDYAEIKSGQWFIYLLKRVVQAYDQNARAEYFQQKYPGLSPDDIADILTSVTTRYAAIGGAIAGAAATTSQIAALSTAGMTAALFVGSIGAEMIYLAQIQMRLVLDLSVLYDLQLDPEDPEDVLMIFGYALAIAPTELIGKGIQVAAGAVAKGTIKKYISKGTLKAVQDFARRIGFTILQRTIIKFSVPVASAAVGSGYNYVSTQSVARIAKAHLKNRGKVSEELRVLVSRQRTYSLVFPASAMFMAQVDGEFSPKEKELYKAMLSRMSFDEHDQAEFQRMLISEEAILEAVVQIEDLEVRRSLVDVLTLMAIYDGKFDEKESEFLIKVAKLLDVPLDIDSVKKRTQDYQDIVKNNIFKRTAGVAGKATESVKDTAVGASHKAKGAIDKFIKRKRVKDKNEV